jgi:hypothetical protein
MYLSQFVFFTESKEVPFLLILPAIACSLCLQSDGRQSEQV